jgi:hypothetical protein
VLLSAITSPAEPYTPARGGTELHPEPQTERAGNRVLAIAMLALGALISALLLFSRRDYVPVFDGRIYADCIVQASTHLTNLGGYRCAGHISQSYVAILALAQRVAPTSPAPMLFANALLLALAATALYRMLARIFPGASHDVGRAIVIGCFLVHPVVLASVVQPGLDFGVLVFALCALAALLERRRWAVVLFGVLLVFSKEPALLVYGVIALMYLWHHRLRHLMPNAPFWCGLAVAGAAFLANAALGNYLSAAFFAVVLVELHWYRVEASRPPLARALRESLAEWPLAIPVLAIGSYMALNAWRNAAAAANAVHAGVTPVVWGGGGVGALVRTVLRPGVIDHATLAVFALMFVLGCLWIPTLFTVVDLIVGLGRLSRRRPPRPMTGVDLNALGVVTGSLVLLIWLLSRYQTFANARYYLPIYPLALIVAYAALVRLGVRRMVRVGAFSGLMLLLALSAVRTVDPVSRELWGTFPFGGRAMLKITGLTGECCGAGRDQLVYNLEFTNLDALQSAAYARLRPSDSTKFVMPEMGDWYTVGPLDRVTRRRTLSYAGAVQPTVLTAREAYFPRGRIADGWYVELPYMRTGNEYSLTKLAEVYELGEPIYVMRDGYGIAFRRMTLRAARK